MKMKYVVALILIVPFLFTVLTISLVPLKSQEARSSSLHIYDCTVEEHQELSWRACKMYDTETHRNYIIVGGMAQAITEVH